jgi:hypothetical protein
LLPNCIKHDGRLGASGLVNLTHALLKFLIGHLEDAEDIVDEGPGIVLGLMPAARALLERLVVAALVLLNQPL